MSIRKALAFSFLDRYAGLLLSIISSMIIARILTPTDIGVFSVTVVLLSFISAWRDMGAGQYLVQEKVLTPDRIRAVWAVQLGLGITFSILVLAASRPVATFYNEPRMIDLMTILALNFAISPFGSLTYAWLMREMRFDTLAVMRFGGSLTGSCVSVLLAWKQYGPLSLAWGSLAATIVNAMLGIRYRPKHFPWVPGLKEIRRVVSFGGRVSLASIVNSVGAGAPDLLLGKLQGLATAGLYSRAFGLASMFHKLVMDAVLSVAMPLFSKAKRENSDVEGTFLTVVSYVTVIGWPFMALLAIFAQPLIRLLYGPQWDESVEVTRFLAVGMALILPGVICITTITAFGAAQRLVRTTITTVAIEVAIIALGASHGLSQIGIAFVCAMCIVSALWIESAHHVLAFKWRRLLRVFGSSALVTMITCVIPVFVAIGLPSSQIPVVLTLLIGLLGGGCCHIAALFFINHPAKDELINFLKSIRSWIQDR